MKLPTNIKEPNFGRWGTISIVAKIVLEHLLPIYSMVQNICYVEKNGSYLHTVATHLWWNSWRREPIYSKIHRRITLHFNFTFLSDLAASCTIQSWVGKEELSSIWRRQSWAYLPSIARPYFLDEAADGCAKQKQSHWMERRARVQQLSVSIVRYVLYTCCIFHFQPWNQLAEWAVVTVLAPRGLSTDGPGPLECL